ncbi:alkaline phosphatase D family protein [Nocardioides sp.]|uniref:alkaline phosphatase D family protein n=1 Tax=Nocardioides sp. TaxID=35761 RepID=UPI002ED5B6A4
MGGTMDRLVLGPLLRYVDTDSATIWVETARAAEVSVSAGDQVATARTFAAHGHHYAVVEVTGLGEGTRTPYRVSVDGEQVWPEPGTPYPDPVIATLDSDQPLRLAFGSCRVSVPHDEDGNRAFGVDALRAFALDLARGGGEEWPDLVLFLGDQVYADETSDEMKEFIASRRSLDVPPGEELRDFEEYAHLYNLAWSEPANRWLLSTVPSAMIFDDHDIRDDWNTSWTWRREMEDTSWWRLRIVSGLGSYWVYQHLGNLSSAERAQDELWQQIAAHDQEDELDVTEALDALAERADRDPASYRWSHARDFGDQARLVVVDSRAARVLQPEDRSILDPGEMAWFDDQLQGGFDHVLIGTSLPFLLAPGLHFVEAFNEGVCSGAWGRLAARAGERMRQGMDMEHWAAFQQGFRDVAQLTLEVASGGRGRAPQSVVFLSGDVHHSYVASAWPDPDVTDTEIDGRILQATCSPIRNPLPRVMEHLTTWATNRRVGRTVQRLARSAKVPRSPLGWKVDRGPWYDNNLALLDVQPGGGLRIRWVAGDVSGRAPDDPTLREVAVVDVPGSATRRPDGQPASA